MTPSSSTTKTTHKKFETRTTININWKFGFCIKGLEKNCRRKLNTKN
jgi:hypothetical protein